MAEVSYYSYEYDPDSQPFLADSDGHDHFELHAGGKGPEHRVVIPADTQLTTLDTKNTPDRWYGPLVMDPLSIDFLMYFAIQVVESKEIHTNHSILI